MFMPDLHIPYQDPEALGCFLHALSTIKPRYLVILGDFIDGAAFSKHALRSFKECKAADFKTSEIDPANELLDRMSKYAGKIIYIEGNHEARIECAALRLGRAMESVYSLISPQSLLSAGRSAKEFEWVSYHQEFKKAHHKVTHRLLTFHGLSTAKHAPAKHLEKLKNYSCVYGHTHRAQSDTRRDPISDDVHVALSPGCLSKLQPLYMHSNPSEWSHGFALSHCRPDGRFTLFNVGIEHGQAILPSGKLVKG
jgi:predicted phosphodiesterase